MMRRGSALAAAGVLALCAACAAAEDLRELDLSWVREAVQRVQGKSLPADNCQFIRDRLADPAVSEVIVPEGTYVCSRPVFMSRSGVTLRGQGRPLLKLADHADCPLLVMGSPDSGADGAPTPVTGLRVEGIALDGNRDRQGWECWGGPCFTGKTTDFHNNGLTLRGVRDSVVRDVEVSGARSGGLVTERDCSGLLVQGLKARDNFYDGLSVNWTRDSTFEDLGLSGNQYAGLTMDIKVSGNVFRNGDISANRDVGIFMRRADGNRFERLNVAGNASHGVYLSDCDGLPGTCATGNTFSAMKAIGNGRDGFHMDAACADNRIETSQSSGNKGEAVHGPWALTPGRG